MIGVKPQNAFGLLPGAPPLARVRPSSFVGRSAGALEWELQRARSFLKKRNTTTSNFNRKRFVCVCVFFVLFFLAARVHHHKVDETLMAFEREASSFCVLV